MSKRTHATAFSSSESSVSMIYYTGKGSYDPTNVYTPEEFIGIMHKNFPQTKKYTLEEMMVFSGAIYFDD